MIKKLIVVCGALCMILRGATFANYDEFVSALTGIKLDAAQIAQQSVVSRYDLAKLLNFVDCHDCHRPGNDLVSTLTSSRWDMFRVMPTANFDDVSFNTSIDMNNNYYCVAYVADKGYMAGYPRQTSPLCSGKFCGSNNTTVADFIQVIINILADRIASHYQIDRRSMNTRMHAPANDALVRKYFTLSEQSLVYANAVASGSQSLRSSQEFSVYLKYCTFNLSACGMSERKTAKEGFWPVAELNVLVLEGIITEAEANALNVNDYIDGQTVLTSLAQVKEKVACTLTNDQDYDGIPDYADNCYLTYNPSQKDTNHNGIGDVCDSDIDGDGVTNPIGIIDDNGNISTKGWKDYSGGNTGNGGGGMDNCLVVSNPDQKDSNGDGIGDACEESLYYGLSIVTRKIRNSTYALAANYTGALKNFAWDFGDGSYGEGKATSHTFPGAGTYQVVLTALGGTKTYVATTTIVVAQNMQAAIGFQILPNPLTANVPATIAVTPVTTRPVGRIERQTNNQLKNGANAQVMSFVYENGGNYPIVAKAYDDQQIVAYAQGSVSINGSIAAYLQASTLTPVVGQQVTFSTTTAGIQKKDIVSVKWDFGDGTIQTNTLLTTTYSYAHTGPQIITQTIYLLDGTTLVNIININVVSEQISDDQGVDLLPAKLVMYTGEPVRYRFILNGIQRADIARIFVDMGDGQHLTFDNTITDGFDYTYIVPAIYRVVARVQKNDGTRFNPAAHITVIGVPLCLQPTPVAGACDMDKDGIPDMCDDDIDGDGKKNMLGLIVHQPPNCKYVATDLNQSIIATTITRISKGDGLDNCPLTVNPDQKDLNGNFIGDICEGLIKLDGDKDGDGITDSQDACPDTPENFNGIEDTDGCPEFVNVTDVTPGVQAAQCNLCPCPYVQSDADLVQGDKVRAVLLNATGARINTSQTEIIE